MNTYKYIVLTILCFTLSSCSKTFEENDTDLFVGRYSVSVTQYVVWGGSSGTLTDSGVLRISKVSSTKVKTTGYFHTTGEVVGSTIYFESMYASDSAGYFTTTFDAATLNGNVLTFKTHRSGQLEYGGIMYPYRSTDNFTLIKQ